MAIEAEQLLRRRRGVGDCRVGRRRGGVGVAPGRHDRRRDHLVDAGNVFEVDDPGKSRGFDVEIIRRLPFVFVRLEAPRPDLHGGVGGTLQGVEK